MRRYPLIGVSAHRPRSFTRLESLRPKTTNRGRQSADRGVAARLAPPAFVVGALSISTSSDGPPRYIEIMPVEPTSVMHRGARRQSVPCSR